MSQSTAVPPQPFIGSIYRCADCQGLMQSKFPGDFSACACGNSFVDQSRYYTRLGGLRPPELVQGGQS